MPAGLSCSQEKSEEQVQYIYSRFLSCYSPANRFVTVNMFESEESDSSVLRKSMFEGDEWEKEEVEEVVLTSATDREPAVHATLDSLSCQDFGLRELAYADEPLADDE